MLHVLKCFLINMPVVNDPMPEARALNEASEERIKVSHLAVRLHTMEGTRLIAIPSLIFYIQTL